MTERNFPRLFSHSPHLSPLSLFALAATFALPLPQHNRLAGLDSWCPFFHLTGLPCPFCGMTRSLSCCAHGQWNQAWHYHLLGPLLFAFLVASSTRYALQLLARRFIDTSPATKVEAKNGRVWWIISAVFLVVWITRLSGFWPLPS